MKNFTEKITSFLWPLLIITFSISALSADLECTSTVLGLFGKTKRMDLGLPEKSIESLDEKVKIHLGEDFISRAHTNTTEEEIRTFEALVYEHIKADRIKEGALKRRGREFFTIQLPEAIATFFSNIVDRKFFFLRYSILKEKKFHIYGQRRTPKGLADNIVTISEDFDTRAKSWGLSIPKQTKIIILDRPFFPRIGPSSSMAPDNPPIIIFAPLWTKGLNIREEIIMHERVHTILFDSFVPNNYINKSTFIHEALADFLTAHISGNPNILFRNISTMESEGIKIDSLKSLSNDDFFNDHDLSLPLSNLLWRLRKEIGERNISKMLSSFFHQLNSNDKFVEIDNIISEYEYFAAVLLKTASEEGHGEIAERIVQDSAKDLSFNTQKISFLLNHLNDQPDLRE